MRPNAETSNEFADIHIQVRELQQLFNSLDPTPFPDRDLDERAEEFIIGWAKEHPSHLPLRLLIKLGQPVAPQTDSRWVRDAVGHYFTYRAEALDLQLRQLLSIGRKSLVVGLVCLGLSVGGAHAIGRLGQSAWLRVLSESLIIGGWVAMWRPLQIFLYDWWPIRRNRALCLRLACAEVLLITPDEGGSPPSQPSTHPGNGSRPPSSFNKA